MEYVEGQKVRCVIFSDLHVGSSSAFLEALRTGTRLQSPPDCPADVYDLMRRCWDLNPLLRPTFATLARDLKLLQDPTVHVHFERATQEQYQRHESLRHKSLYFSMDKCRPASQRLDEEDEAQASRGQREEDPGRKPAHESSGGYSLLVREGHRFEPPFPRLTHPMVYLANSETGDYHQTVSTADTVISML